MSEFLKKIENWKEKTKIKLNHTSSIRIIPVVFLVIILIGTFLLMLPAAQKGSRGTDFTDALFTATSATCVTGLIRFDTYSHWTTFGQIVILSMIQIGGLGFMTIAMWIMMFTGQKIGLHSRFMMQSSISAPQVGGMVKMTRFILLGTFLIEGTGAVLLSAVMIPRYGLGKGIYYSVFHSVSAFCNAGFDLMGSEEPFSSLTHLSDNWYFNVVIMALIIVGGLGFFVWRDLLEQDFHFRKLRLHSKLVLSMSGILILTGFLMIFLLEWGEPSTEGKTAGQQMLYALFQSVTVRTAGFNTVNLSKMTEPSLLLMIGLMLIGGSPGSTAGGLKTTTFAVLLISILSVFRRKNQRKPLAEEWKNILCGRRLVYL